VSGAGVEPARL